MKTAKTTRNEENDKEKLVENKKQNVNKM